MNILTYYSTSNSTIFLSCEWSVTFNYCSPDVKITESDLGYTYKVISHSHAKFNLIFIPILLTLSTFFRVYYIVKIFTCADIHLIGGVPGCKTGSLATSQVLREDIKAVHLWRCLGNGALAVQLCNNLSFKYGSLMRHAHRPFAAPHSSWRLLF